MNSLKYWKIVCLMVFIIILTLSAALSGLTVNDEDILGDWECLVETEDEEDFIFVLHFTEPNQVTYIAGWYLSEIASMYTGEYTVENDDVLKLEMTEVDSSDTISGVYTFTISDGKLILTKQGGDSLSYLFEEDVPMEFTAVVLEESSL